MKKLATIFGVFLMNIILVIIAFYIYREKIKIEKLTEETNFEVIIFISTLIIFIVSIGLIDKRRLFKISFGLFFIIFSSITFVVFWLNIKFSSKGEFTTLKIRDAVWEDNGFFLNPEFKETESIIKVEQSVCFKVDSINFRIDNGLFGLKILTSEAKIVPSKRCDNSLCQENTANNYETFFNNGQEFAKVRCYFQSICEFNKAIKLDKTESKTYYYRGTSFLALQNYKSALKDFYKALEIEKAKNSNTKIEQAFNENPDELVETILSSIESKNTRNIEAINIDEKLEKIKLAERFDNYIIRLNYCIEKLNLRPRSHLASE